jgi:hypothetical protein
MKKENVLKQLKSYLRIFDTSIMNRKDETVFIGRGEIKTYIPKLLILQKQLANEMLSFGTFYLKDYAFYEKDMKKGVYPIFVHVKKCKEFNETILKNAISLANKEYKTLCIEKQGK